MSRINTNIPSLIGQRTLRQQNLSLNKSLERLSTGLRINRGSDDPAGLIASENLRAEMKALTSAISNGERAEQVINVAEGGLQEISGLLQEIQGLVGASANDAGLSNEEKEANQQQIDSILQTIDRIANATSFQGTKLLNGNFDYTTSSVNSTLLTDVNVNSAKLPTAANSYVSVTVDVLTSAQTAEVYLSTAATFDAQDGGSYTIEIAGDLGTQQITIASNATQASIISAINQFKDVTGVSAAQNGTNTDRVELRSKEFGTNSFVRVKEVAGTAGDLIFAAETGGSGVNLLKDTGRDAVLTINGTQATTDGLTARVANDGFDVSVTIGGTSALNTTGGQSTFEITGGGATFSLAPDVNLAGKVSLGIRTVTSGNLGNGVDGFLSDLKSGGTSNVLNGDLDKAQLVVDSAIKQTSTLRGRLGAFQSNVVGASLRSLGISFENTAAAESQIRDTDFAKETAGLTRSQILVQAATTVLSLSNSQPQSVLSLLG